MTEFAPRLDDVNFTLNHVAGLEKIAKLNGYQHADPASVADILDEAGRFFAEVIAPLNRIGDIQGSILTDDGTVQTPDGFKEAYKKLVESGWTSAHMPKEWGGGGLPYLVGVALQEIGKTANMAFSLCPMLTHGAVEALKTHASPALQELYMEKLVSGEWSGTMNLTEPEAGSDVGALRTKAIKQSDGTYRLFGTKIFITWGDQDLTENIIHTVLARTPDAPPGTRGISMYLVPKFILDEDGLPGPMNDIKTVSLEHKLGIRASPTCVISFGDAGDGAVGYIIGAEQEGMRHMFTMMNGARIGVGMEGVAISERAYQAAVAYAQERIQGREISGDTKDKAPIIQHPDVRRMLLTMKAYTEAMRSLLYVSAAEADMMFHAETEDQRQAASNRIVLLTPIVKAWCTDIGVEMASLGIQVHGGMGYIEETGAAQFYRDARISPIYEGTNGIQAIDLVLRKLPLENGAVVTSPDHRDCRSSKCDERSPRAECIPGRDDRSSPGLGRYFLLARREAGAERHKDRPGRRHPLPPSVRHGDRRLDDGQISPGRIGFAGRRRSGLRRRESDHRKVLRRTAAASGKRTDPGDQRRFRHPGKGGLLRHNRVGQADS